GCAACPRLRPGAIGRRYRTPRRTAPPWRRQRPPRAFSCASRRSSWCDLCDAVGLVRTGPDQWWEDGTVARTVSREAAAVLSGSGSELPAVAELDHPVA